MLGLCRGWVPVKEKRDIQEERTRLAGYVGWKEYGDNAAFGIGLSKDGSGRV